MHWSCYCFGYELPALHTKIPYGKIKEKHHTKQHILRVSIPFIYIYIFIAKILLSSGFHGIIFRYYLRKSLLSCSDDFELMLFSVTVLTMIHHYFHSIYHVESATAMKWKNTAKLWGIAMMIKGLGVKPIYHFKLLIISVSCILTFGIPSNIDTSSCKMWILGNYQTITWFIVKQTVRLYMLNLNYLEKLLVEWTLKSSTEHKYFGTVMGV